MSSGREQLILIVDDRPENLDVLYNFLLGAGYGVAVALDGPAALEQIERYPPDLILLDVALGGGMDGFEVMRRLRANPATFDIPVIFMTALADTDSKLAGMRLGAVDYITKPLHSEDVLARVQVHLRMRQLTQSLSDSNLRLQQENQERAAAEAGLERLTRELEQRVEGRTAELTSALSELMRVKTELAATNDALTRANEALTQDAALREEQLHEARERIERELAERERHRAAMQEEIIAVQRASLEELSTPMIPITDRIMVIPMIGAVSDERAQLLMETALEGVHSQRARVVIIDVTGMKRMDSSSARMLTQTASALALLGAQAVITGVRPELAQALARGGVDLGAAVIQGTLQSGIVYALRKAGSDASLLRAVAAPR
ncbi:MAG TPA: response regulator [Polyangiaceae bacterium]|nr:response regulator [Polyangiaceae bacterium]